MKKVVSTSAVITIVMPLYKSVNFKQCCGSGAILTPGSGMGTKSRSRDEHPGSSDHISESLETIFSVKILKFYDADLDPGSGIFLTLDPG